MKRVRAPSIIAVLSLAMLAAAADRPMEAKVTKFDAVAKVMTVQDAAGKESTLYWSDATKVEGDLKEGALIHYKAAEKDGKLWATWVHVGEMHKM